MNIEQQIEHLQSQIDKLREQCKQKPEFEYPIYMQYKHCSQVVEFTGLRSGIVVVKGNRSNSEEVGHFSVAWIPHTDDRWQPIAFDEERGIADKQLCECWDGDDTHRRVLKFYDVKNECSFSYDGKRNGLDYNNYHPIPYADSPEWAIEAEKTLED
jgi:hypothetical protein